jgi:thiamine biosynthesis protein ThiS
METKISGSINSKKFEIHNGSSLEELIITEKISLDSVATAVNNIFISKAERSKYILKNGDTVIVFSPITGG